MLVQIVSLNAWGGAMFGPLATWIRQSSAELLCLQEVTHTPAVVGWTRFSDGERELPQRADLLSDVSGLLPGHESIFSASDAGPVYAESGDRHRQEFGIASFVERSVEIAGVESTFVHGGFVEHDEWPVDDRPRVALAARVRDRATGRWVSVVQCHGLRDAAGKHDTSARRAQAERLAAFVVRCRQKGDLAVVCGDLNVLPDSNTFDVLADAGLIDLVGWSDTRTSRYAKSVRHASYMLVSDPQAVASFTVIAEPEVSDHRALQLDIAA